MALFCVLLSNLDANCTLHVKLNDNRHFNIPQYVSYMDIIHFAPHLTLSRTEMVEP